MEEPKNPTTPTTPSAPVPPASAETVVVNKDVLNGILQKLDMLESAADRNRVERWQNQHGKPLPKNVRISKYNGKFVLAWRMMTNEVSLHPVTGAWIEKQDMEVIYADNSKETVPYRHFMATHMKINAEIEKSTKDSDGVETLIVTVVDPEDQGQKLTIDARFVN